MPLSTSELLRVRAAALAFIAIVAWLSSLLLVQRIPVMGSGHDGAAHGGLVSAITIRREFTAKSPQATPLQVPPVNSSTSAPAAALDANSGGQGTHVWLHGAAGRVYFENEGDYTRCMEAAIAGLTIEGCPPPPSGVSLAQAAAQRMREMTENTLASEQTNER